STIISDAVLGNVDAAKIGTGYLDADRIEAGSLTAEKVLIGGAGNVIPWAPATTTYPHEPRYGATLTGEMDPDVGALMRVAGGVRSDGEMLACLVLGTGDTVPGVPNSHSFMPLDPGRSYFLTASMRIDGTIPGGNNAVRYEIQYLDGLGAYIDRQYGAFHYLSATDPQDVFMDVAPPAGTAFAVVHVRKNFWSSGDLLILAPSLRVRSGATLIEDGAITTRHIESGSITAESGIIGSIDAGVITVGEMNGARIEAGTVDTPQLAFGSATGDILSADALNFKTAQGLDIRSSAFRAGDSVEITEDFGIRQF